MAQLNITLNQEEIQALLLDDRGEAFKKILQTSLNKILQVESAEQLKAAPYERSEERTDCRNGSRDRDLNTRVGRITLHVPRHRNVPFKTLVFDNYSPMRILFCVLWVPCSWSVTMPCWPEGLFSVKILCLRF